MAENKEGAGKGAVNNPEAAAEIAKAMAAAKASAADVTRAFESQLKVILELREAMASISGNMDKMCQPESGGMSPEKWNNVTKAVEETSKATGAATKATEGMAKVMQSSWTKAATTAAGALTGLRQGFKNIVAMGKSVGGFFSSVAGGVFDVGKAILAAPFKMLGGLIKMADSGGGGNELAAAYENVREQFGSLQSESSRTVIDVAKNMDKMNETGVSAMRIFGTMAERIEAVNKMATAMGNTFQVFQNEIQQNGVAIMMYQKGLGLTDEQMQSVASTAMRMGKGVADVQNEMTKQAVGMSKAFGVNAKVLSKDMGKAMQDLAHFGHLSTKEMAVAATFAQKLGVSVDKLTAVMDATATFDQAAEGMSKLNEQFGTNIDATKIMEAQNPAEKVEMLRKEFAKTGKDMSKLSYQEKMLIKQSSGLDDAMMDAAFSAKNAGVSLDQISKQGSKNESKTMSQAEAMKELGDQIKRLTPSGGGGGGGFMDHIMRGFKNGLMSGENFRVLMENIRRTLAKAEQFGVKLGKMFYDLFPGVKDTLGGLKELFNPAKFQKMFDGVLKAFDVFKVGGSGKIEDFMANIQKVFLDFFNDGKPAGKDVLKGFKKFGEAALKIFGKMSEFIINKLADIIVGITDWLKKPKLPDVSGTADGLGSALAGPFDGALKALSEKLGPALKDFVGVLMGKLVSALAGISLKSKMIVGGVLGGMLFGPALLQGVVGLASGGLFKSAGKLLTDGLSKGIKSSAPEGAKKLGESVTGPASALAKALPEAEDLKKMQAASTSKIDWPGLTKFILGMSGVLLVGLGAFMISLKIVKGEDPKDLIAAGAVLLALIPVISSMAGLSATLSQVKGVDPKSLVSVILGMAGLMLVGLGAFWVALQVVKGVPVADLLKAGLALTITTGIMALMGPLLIEAAIVGEIVKSNAAAVIVGMVSMGLAVIAIAGVAWIITEMLGSLPASELAKSIIATTALIPAFIASGLVIGVAALVGSAIIASGGAGAVAIIVGMVAMGAALVAIGATALILTDMLGDLDMGAIITTGAVMTYMTAAFVASGALITIAAGIGAAIIATAGVGATAIIIGMTAMSEALKHIASTALVLIDTLGSVDVGKALKSGTIMTVMIGMFGAAGLLVAAAGVIGMAVLATAGIGAVAIEIGMETMQNALFKMADTAVSIINKLKSVDPSKALLAGTIMTAMGAAFAATGLIIAEAAVVGATMMSVLGLGGVAIRKGMDMMSEVLNLLVQKTSEIMVVLNQVQGDPATLEAKSKAFSTVLESVGKLTESVGTALGKIDWEDIGDSSNGLQTIDKIKDFMNALIMGSPPGSGGVAGLVKTLIDSLAKVDKQGVEAAKAIAPLLQSVVSLSNSVSGPAMEIMKSSTHWYQGSEADNAEAAGRMKTISDFVSQIITPVQGLITAISTSLQSITVDPKTLSAAGPIIGDTLKSVTSLVGTIMPALKDMKKKTDGDESVDTAGIKSAGEFMGKIVGALTGEAGLLKIVDDIIKKTGSINLGEVTPAKLESMTKIVGILGSMTGAAATVMGAFKAGKTEKTTDSKDVLLNKGKMSDTVGKIEKTTEVITESGPKFADVLEAMGKEIPNILGKMISAVDAIPLTATNKDFAGKLDAAVKMFEMVKVMSDFFGNFMKASEVKEPPIKDKSEAAKIVKPFEGWGQTIAAFADALWSLIDPETVKGMKGWSSKTAIEGVAVSLGAVSKAIAGLDMKQAKTVMDFLDGISKMYKNFKDMSGDLDTGGGDPMKAAEELSKKWWRTIVAIGSALWGLYRTDGAWIPPGWQNSALVGTKIAVEKVAELLGGFDSKKIADINAKMKELTGLMNAMNTSVDNKGGADDVIINTLAKPWWRTVAVIGNALWGLYRTDGEWKPAGWQMGVLPGTIASLDETIKIGKGLTPEKTTAVQKIFTDLGGFQTAFTSAGKFNADEALKSIRSLASAMEEFTGTGPSTGVLGRIRNSVDSITAMGEGLKSKGLAPAVQAVSDIVKAVQQLDDVLHRGAKGQINIKAKMEQFAKAAGLGAAGIYEVQGKEVSINVKFEIYMDADKVEKAIVLRQESLIRDRINHIYEGGTNPPTASGTAGPEQGKINYSASNAPRLSKHSS